MCLLCAAWQPQKHLFVDFCQLLNSDHMEGPSGPRECTHFCHMLTQILADLRGRHLSALRPSMNLSWPAMHASDVLCSFLRCQRAGHVRAVAPLHGCEFECSTRATSSRSCHRRRSLPHFGHSLVRVSCCTLEGSSRTKPACELSNSSCRHASWNAPCQPLHRRRQQRMVPSMSSSGV